MRKQQSQAVGHADPAATISTVPHIQFTIRSLMIAVALVAGLLATLLLCPDLLLLLIVVGIPLTGLSGLLARIPAHRPEWRRWIAAVMFGMIVLAVGWIWARGVIASFQRADGTYRLGDSADIEFWGLIVPAAVTGISLIVYVLGLGITCALRGRLQLMLPIVGYGLSLAAAWLCLFAALRIEFFY
jgi:hypothetical protein